MSIEKVDGKIFYHIDKGNWEIGKTYHIGEENNRFLNECLMEDYNCIKTQADKMAKNLQQLGFLLDMKGKILEEIFFLRTVTSKIDESQPTDIKESIEVRRGELIDLRKAYIDNKVPELCDMMEEYITLSGILRNYLLLVREYVFEEVRNESYSALPSRKKCRWVIANDIHLNEAIIFWWNELGRKGKLLKLELKGDIFIGDEGYLNLTTKPMDYLKEQAHEYWQGKLSSDQRHHEYLFVGKAKVLEVACKDYNEFEANGFNLVVTNP